MFLAKLGAPVSTIYLLVEKTPVLESWQSRIWSCDHRGIEDLCHVIIWCLRYTTEHKRLLAPIYHDSMEDQIGLMNIITGDKMKVKQFVIKTSEY